MKRLALSLLILMMMAIPAMAADDAVSVNSSSVKKNVTYRIDDSGVTWEWMPDYLSNDKMAKTTAAVEIKSVDDEYTKSLLHLNGTDGSTVFADESGKTWSAAGNAQIDTSESMFGNASLVHDGSGDYISTSDSSDWDLGQAFTVDFWVRFDELPPSVTLVGTNAIDSRYYKPGWFIAYQRELEALRMSYHDGSSWKYHMYSPWDVSTDTWYHVAVSRDESGVLRQFINGQQTGSMVNTNSITSGPQNLFIGGINGLSANSFSGNIDEVRISKGIARWTTDFTPPTHEYGMEVAPVADFTGTPVSGYAPLTVQFTDVSENDPTSWLWTFGDGGTSTLQNPSHEYTSPGEYTVTFTATNDVGNDTETKTDYIEVTPYRVYAEVGGTGLESMAEGFWNIISEANNGYIQWEDWQGESGGVIGLTDARESHWTSNSDQWIENADFVYFSGHGYADGSDSRIDFTYPDESSGLYYAYSSDMNLGAGRTKWVVLDSCECLKREYADNWDNHLNGLHILLGWNTTTVPSYDIGNNGRGQVFAELMEGDYYQNRSVFKIIDAWNWAGWYTWGHIPSSSNDTDVFNAVIYDGNCENDYLPGWGSFSSSTSGFLHYRSILIFKQTGSDEGKSASFRSLNITEGRYSLVAAIPDADTIMVYKSVESEYSKEWAGRLEKSLGMSGDVEESNGIYYADNSDAEKYYFFVEKDSSTISFQKFDGRTGFPNSKIDYMSTANSFLEKNGLMTPEVQNPRVAYNGEESLTKSGDRKAEWRTTVVTYSREINNLPVWNCQKMVELDSGGNVIGYFQNWRNYEPYREYELKSPEKAFEEFMVEQDLATKDSPDSIVVTDVALGYYSQPAASDEEYLQPIYVYEGYSQYGKSTEEFEPVVISAIDEVFNEIP